MKYTTFSSKNGWLEFEYPTSWDQREVDKGTYLFKNDKHWKGNFRVTPLKVSGVDKNSQPFNIDDYVMEQIQKNPGAQLIELGQYKTANYITSATDEDIPLTIQNWIFGRDSTIIVASYTTTTKNRGNRNVRQEIEECKKAISTLKIK
jgi:hypothetical protein